MGDSTEIPLKIAVQAVSYIENSVISGDICKTLMSYSALPDSLARSQTFVTKLLRRQALSDEERKQFAEAVLPFAKIACETALAACK